MSGFLMGGLVQGPQKLVFQGGPALYQRMTDPEAFKEYKKNKEEYVKNTVDVLNEIYENPEEYFDPTKLQALTQKEVNESLFSSSFQEDARSFMDKKDAGIFSAIHTLVQSGKLHEFKDQMEDYLKLDDKGLAEAFKMATPEEIKSGKTRERIEGMKDRMDDIEKAYKELNDKIVNPFDPSTYKKGTKEHQNEIISQQAFNHAKMLALYTRDTFERALERSNQIYTELSADPIVSKMAANDIGVLADTQQLIAEIRLLKVELKNMKTPVEEGVPRVLSEVEKTEHDKKKKRLELLQDYFSVLTDPEHIEKYDDVTSKKGEPSKEDKEFNDLGHVVGTDAAKQIRENILSNKDITDREAEELATYGVGTANPFGVFDIDNIEKLKGSVMEYLSNISGESKDSFIIHDKIDALLEKLVDFKALNGRAQDYNKAIATIVNPKHLGKLAEKIAVKFKELFMENKLGVKRRMVAFVEQKEKVEFLKQLAEYGIYPEEQQTVAFLKGGGAPYIYYTEEGVLTPDLNLELEQKKDEILGAYLNLSDNKMQKKETEETEEEVDQEYDPHNFENTHFEKSEEGENVNETDFGKYTGNRYGDEYLVRKHKEYLLNQEGSKSKSKLLTDHAEWLASPISKKVRVVESAINRIYDEVYVEEKLVGKSETTFYNWLVTMKDEPRVSDILRSVDVKISDIIEKDTESEVVKGKKIISKKKSAYKIRQEEVRDKESGDTVKVFTVVDNENNPVDDKVYTSKKEAQQSKNEKSKTKKDSDASKKPFPFAGSEYKRGDVLMDGDGNRYMVFSTLAMVETNENIYLKKLEKINSRLKKDKLFRDEAAFKAMKLDKVSDNVLDYKNRAGKIKINEPLVITPVWDYTLAEYAESGIFDQQKVLRNLTLEDREKITFKITTGPKWFTAEETEVTNKKNFKESTEGVENDLIKKHGQKWQVEVQFNGETIGYFQGPTTLLLINRKGGLINPMEITESQVQDIFKIYAKDDITVKTKEIQDNYIQSFDIYNKINELMAAKPEVTEAGKVITEAVKAKDEGNFTQEELGVVLNISEGSMAIAGNKEGVSFEDLDHNTIAGISKEDLNNPEEEPYFILDYNRQYKGDGVTPITKVEHNAITNIRTNTPAYKKMKEEIKKYEKKFSPRYKLGKYVAFVTMPNGRSAFVNIKPQTMTENTVIGLFTELQKQSMKTTKENISEKGEVITEGYNRKFNTKFQEKLFIASTEGVYLEMKLSQDGSFRVDYSDLTVKKVKKGQKQLDIDRAKIVIKADKFQDLTDVEDLLEIVNNTMFGKASPIKDKALITLDNFKNSLPKNPTIEDIGKTSTSLEKEVKKDINFSLSSTESIHSIRRKVAKSEPKEKTQHADSLTPEEKQDAHLNDFENISPEILEDIARRQLDPEVELTIFEEKIAKFNSEILKGLRLKLATKSVSSVNTTEESDNQKAVNDIHAIVSRVSERKKEIRKENRSKWTTGKEAVTDQELHRLNKEAIANDAELKELTLKLIVAKGTANKIIKDFDGHNIEDIETFVQWVKDNLPEDIRIDIDNLGKKLKNGYITVGMFMMQMKNISKGIAGLEGVITVGANNPFKYHEAFHAVFRMLLTDVEISKYLSIAKKEVRAKLRKEGKTLAEALNDMKKQHSMYAEMPKDILEARLYEEYLADEFDKFKMNPSSSKTSSESKSIFRRILDFISEVLGNFRPRQLNELFEGIDSGKYKNTSIKENRFTKSFDGQVAYKLELFNDKYIQREAKDGSSKIKQVKNYVPADQVHEIVSGIANVYVNRLSKAKIPVDRKEILDKTVKEWIDIYNPDREFYVTRGEWYDENVDELELLHSSLLGQVSDIKQQVFRHMDEFSTTPSESIEDVDYTEQDEKSVGDYDKSADMFGGHSSLPKRFRYFIATTTIEEQDRYGNKYINEETGEPLIISVDPYKVYNILIKSLSNTKGDINMLKKAWVAGANNPHTQAVIHKFFRVTGLYEFASSGEMFKEGAELPSQIRNSSLYLSLIKGFKKSSVDKIFAHTDTDTGITHLYAANKKDDAHHTIKQWAEDFNRLYSKVKLQGSTENTEVKDALTGLTSLLKLTTIHKDYNILEDIKYIADTLRTSAGMNIHENYILYSIYSNMETRLTEEQEVLFDTYKHIDPIEIEAISQIRESISLGENLYLDNQTIKTVDENDDAEFKLEFEKGGVKGRLRKIALNNSHFDETVGASTYIDAEGNRRYGFQENTYFLDKIAEMDNAEWISEKLKEDVFFEKNMLLNDPKFKQMVVNGQVRSLEIVGSKESALMLGDLGLSEQRGRDVKGKGTSFGKLTPREFTLDLLHSYLYQYNRVSPNKTLTGEVKEIEFAMAPTFIRVIESSNSGPLVALPIHKMLNRSKEGIEISETALNKFKNEIRIEFDRAREFYQNEKEGVQNPYSNKERLGKLHTTYTLLTKLKSRNRNVQAKLPKIGKDQRAAITDNTQKIYLADAGATIYTTLSQDQNAVVDIDGESFLMTNKGRKNWKDLTEVEQTKVIDDYRPSITTIENKDKRQFEFMINGVKHYTYSSETKQFFLGYKDLTLFDFTRVEEAEEVETKLVESEETGETEIKVLDTDLTAVEKMENAAKNDIDFDVIFEEIGGKEIIRERLMDEISEFILTLKEVKGYGKVSKELSVGLGEYTKIKDGKDTGYDMSDENYYMELYNLKENDLDFNLAQVYLNNYINAKSFNQILLGDQALSLKDFVDAVKRAKMQQGAGSSASTEIHDESLGVMHTVDHMSAIIFNDFVYEKQYNEIYDRDRARKKETGELTDGQIYITEKTLRYMLFGFGKLNLAQSRVLEDIKLGKEIQLNEEFFGTANKLSHKNLDMIANSLKIVYGDGQTFLKMSATLLSKNLTSVRNEDGEWVAKEGREEMHNLRVKLEKMEMDAWSEGRGTLGMAVPKSASKMMNMNVVEDNTTMTDTSDINPDNITNLSADYMRLQMINPSNKIEIVDARQIKNLITGEQDLDAEVILDGEPIKVRDLIIMYHKLTGDKTKNNFFAQRNLTFTWAGAMNSLDKVKTLNKFIPNAEAKRLEVNLNAFVKYAIAGLESSQAKTQMLSYFQVDEYGEPQYNLNGPFTHDKFEELFFAYFSKGILAAKQPGISAALVSDYGMRIVKQVRQVDENGTPIEWDVIRSNDWEMLKRRNPGKYKARKYSDPTKETHTNLKTGDFYVDRLRSNVMEYKNGKATGQRYTEFMMPPHFKSILDNQIDWSKPIPDSVAKMFGIRIPSQDKHSAVNLKLVDYLPVYMGSSAMYARELIELSGADFDIDKLYMHMKSFFHNGSDFVEYGKVNSETEGYRHYVRNVIENATKGGAIRQAIDRWSTKDSKVIDTTTFTAEQYNLLTPEERKIHHQELTKSNKKIVIDLLDAIIHGPSLSDEMTEALYNRAEGLPEALEILGLPVTFEEYKEYLKEYKREPYQAAIDNKLLDVKFGLLGNKGIVEPRKGRHTGLYFEPAVTTPLSDKVGYDQGMEGGVWEWLKDEVGDVLNIMGENEVDVDSLLGQFEAWTNNKEGARSIGSVVLPNVMMSILTEYKIKLRSSKVKGIEKFLIPEMNGVTYDTFEFDYARDHSTKKSDPALHRKQFIISALITAMTDNAKERLAAKLGLKKQVLPTVVTMLGLGVDLKSAVLLINFPTIKEALFHGENKDGTFDPGYKKLLDKRLIAIEEALFEDLIKTKTTGTPHTPVQVNMNNLKAGIQSITFDRAEPFITYGISDAVNPELDIEQLLLEKAVIQQYLNFANISETLRQAGNLLDLQKGFGKDLSELELKEEAAEELGLLATDKEFKESGIPVDLRPVFLRKGSMHNTYYEIFREFYDKLTPLVLLKRTPKFVELNNKVLANLDSSPFKMGPQHKKEVRRDIVNYLTIKAYMESLSKDKWASKTLPSLSNSMIYDGKIFSNTIDRDATSIRDILDRIKARLGEESKTNFFINNFMKFTETEHEDNKAGVMKFEANTWGQWSDSDLTRVQNSVLELLTLDEGNGNMYDDVMNLVHYSAVMHGLSFGDGSFINVIPTPLTKDLLNNVDKVHELFLDTKDREGSYISVFGMSYDEMVDEFVRGYLKSKSTGFFLKNARIFDVIKDRNTEPITNIGEGAESMTIDYDIRESSSNSKMLSNIAHRPFTYKFKGQDYNFGSVMHAFQTLKSGKFDKATDAKYRKGSNADEIKNAEGKMIEGKSKKQKGSADYSYLLTKIVEESILQNLKLENISSSLLPQILIHPKTFNFSHEDWVTKATRKGLLNARENIEYVELTDEQKQDPFSSRTFVDSRDVSDRISDNKRIQERSPVFINQPEKKLIIDLFRGLPFQFNERLKGIRFMTKVGNQKKNQENIEKRNKMLVKVRKAGFSVRWIKMKIGNKMESVPQVEFPAVIRVRDQYFELKTVHRDGAYKTEGDLNNMIPSDSNIAYGNSAEYVEVKLEGSSRQTRIGFMFGPRPTHDDIVQFGKDKRQAYGEGELVLSSEDEQSTSDLANFFGIKREEGEFVNDENKEEYTDFEEIKMENEDNNLELSEGDKLTDFYNSLTTEQQTKLAINDDLGIFSAKDVVSLLSKGKGTDANSIIELLKKCYI